MNAKQDIQKKSRSTLLIQVMFSIRLNSEYFNVNNKLWEGFTFT